MPLFKQVSYSGISPTTTLPYPGPAASTIRRSALVATARSSGASLAAIRPSSARATAPPLARRLGQATKQALTDRTHRRRPDLRVYQLHGIGHSSCYKDQRLIAPDLIIILSAKT
jgi:hypothetical protein